MNASSVASEKLDLKTRRGTLGPLCWLAWPVLMEEFLNLLVGYTDWWLTGHFLGTTEHKAAMGMMGYVLWMLPSMFSAVAIGSTALIARLVGAGDREGARRIMHQAFLLGAVLSVVATVVAYAGAERFIAVLQLDPAAAPLAVQYMKIVAMVIPAIMIEQIAIASLRGAGDTVTGLAAKISVNAVNLVLSAGLASGWAFFPQLGWRGLAIGTAIGHLVGALVLAIALLRGRAGMQLRFAELRPIESIIRRLLRVGLPGGADVLSILACHLAYFTIVNTNGKEASAAHGLGLQIESMAYCPGSAFQVAIATIAGQLLGAGDVLRARRSITTTCTVAVAYFAFAGVVFYVWGLPLTSIFAVTADDPAAKLAAEYLAIVSFCMPSLAVVLVLSGALRGVGDTAWPLIVTFLGLILIRIPVACWLSWDLIRIPFTAWVIEGWGFGVHGAWYAMVVDLVARSMLFLGRFAQGGWQRVKV
ncbi:MAG: Multidrug resistance protein MdtK [Planctomycetota bacterium]